MAVPDLSFAECANVLWKKVSQNAAAQVATLPGRSVELPLTVVPTCDLATNASPLPASTASPYTTPVT
jgi:hypothetical protein